MSTYSDICKQRCEWCAAGLLRYSLLDGSYYHADATWKADRWEKCTAPTPEQVIEEQAADIERQAQPLELLAQKDAEIERITKQRDDAIALELERRKVFVSDARLFAKFMAQRDVEIEGLRGALGLAKKWIPVGGGGAFEMHEQIDAALAAVPPAPASEGVCTECGVSLVHVAGPGVQATLCPVCDADSSGFEDSPITEGGK